MDPDDRTAPGGAHYLIVLSDCVVLQDLSDTVTEFDAGATVIAVNRVDDALCALEGIAELAVAFIEAAPDGSAGTKLSGAIRARHGRIIYLGDDAEDAREGIRTTVLKRPFSPEIVFRSLGALLQR